MPGLMRMWIGRNTLMPWPENRESYAIWARSRWEAQVVLARHLGVYNPFDGDLGHGSVVRRQNMGIDERFYCPPLHARLVSANDYDPDLNLEGFERHRPHIRLCPPFPDKQTGKILVPANPFENVDEPDDEVLPNPRNHEEVSIQPECKIIRNPRNSA